MIPQQGAPAAEKEIELPALREDLRLIGGSGRMGWLIYDPVQHRYTQIDEQLFRVLSLWRRHKTAGTLMAEAAERYGLVLDAAEIGHFIDFAHRSSLTLEAPGGWRHYAKTQAAMKHGLFTQILHNYLFFRIPLLKPDAFLRRTYPFVAPLYSRKAGMAILALGLCGLYLASRQWDQFLHTFQHFFSLEGLAVFALVLVISKVFHELGHAYTAVRYGCSVPTLGIAFMLMTPMLYTDTTDAWRLRSRRKRMAIDAAGVIVELALACIATLLWVFLPEGPAKSAAFLVAAANWIVSLGINLNPFMRFDGYYLLADFTGVENLQPRAFAMGSWKLKELLFGLGLPPPETATRARMRFLWIYAWLVWIYRVVLFVGIALLVYHYFMKVVGVVLFLVEIGYFVAKPIWGEIKEWWMLRDRIMQGRRILVTGGAIAACLVAAALPLSGRVTVPSVAEADGLMRYYAPRPARIEEVAVKAGQEVAVGDVLVRLSSAELDNELKLTDRRIKVTRMRLARRTADAEDRVDSLVLERELSSLAAKREGLLKELAELTVRAQRAGIVLEIDPELHPGRSITLKEMIALIGDKSLSVVQGYLAEADLWRIKPGTEGRFVPDDPELSSFNVSVSDIAVAGAASLEIPELSSTHGGPIAASQDAEHREIPIVAQYRVRFESEAPAETLHSAARGKVVLDGEAESFLSRGMRQVLKVLVRESGA